MLRDFKDFLMKGNIVELAVAFVMGVAFGAAYLALPAISSAFLSQPISIFPLPFKDLTEHTQDFLPAVPMILSFNLGLVISGKARNAIDLGKEKKELREAYGMNTFGQSCLLARRLVEAGARFPDFRFPVIG